MCTPFSRQMPARAPPPNHRIGEMMEMLVCVEGIRGEREVVAFVRRRHPRARFVLLSRTIISVVRMPNTSSKKSRSARTSAASRLR